jgi:hypothetical protein
MKMWWKTQLKIEILSENCATLAFYTLNPVLYVVWDGQSLLSAPCWTQRSGERRRARFKLRHTSLADVVTVTSVTSAPAAEIDHPSLPHLTSHQPRPLSLHHIESSCWDEQEWVTLECSAHYASPGTISHPLSTPRSLFNLWPRNVTSFSGRLFLAFSQSLYLSNHSTVRLQTFGVYLSAIYLPFEIRNSKIGAIHRPHSAIFFG